MSEISSTPTSTPNRLAELHHMVWSIPNIRSEIMFYLPKKDVITILTTSKIHFQGSVEKLYKVFPYKAYSQSIEQCQDKYRKNLYRDSVCIIELDKTTPYSRWVQHFQPFPNATFIQTSNASYYCWIIPAMLELTCHRSPKRYVFTPDIRIRIWDVTEAMPRPASTDGIPRTWSRSTVLDFYFEDSTRSLSSQDHANIQIKMQELQNWEPCLLRALDSSPDISSRLILKACQKLHAVGRLNLQHLVISNLKTKTVDLIRLTAHSSLSLIIRLDGPRDNGATLDEVVNAFDWAKFVNLKRLAIHSHCGYSRMNHICEPAPTHNFPVPGQHLIRVSLELSYPKNMNVEKQITGIRAAASKLSTFLDPTSEPNHRIDVYVPPCSHSQRELSHVLSQVFNDELRKMAKDLKAREARYSSRR